MNDNKTLYRNSVAVSSSLISNIPLTTVPLDQFLSTGGIPVLNS